jgi:predicted MFS family arabinose efflux permease
MNVPTIVFHVTNCVTLLSQIAIAAFAFAAYKRNHKSGFLFIALASVIFFWNVAFHYLVQFHVVTPEARWSQRDSNIINAINGAVYIIGAALDVVGIARLCSRTENTAP